MAKPRWRGLLLQATSMPIVWPFPPLQIVISKQIFRHTVRRPWRTDSAPGSTSPDRIAIAAPNQSASHRQPERCAHFLKGARLEQGLPIPRRESHRQNPPQRRRIRQRNTGAERSAYFHLRHGPVFHAQIPIFGRFPSEPRRDPAVRTLYVHSYRNQDQRPEGEQGLQLHSSRSEAVRAAQRLQRFEKRGLRK